MFYVIFFTLLKNTESLKFRDFPKVSIFYNILFFLSLFLLSCLSGCAFNDFVVMIVCVCLYVYFMSFLCFIELDFRWWNKTLNGTKRPKNKFNILAASPKRSIHTITLSALHSPVSSLHSLADFNPFDKYKC